MTIKINEIEYSNVELIVSNGEISCTFQNLADEDINPICAATQMHEIINSEIVSTFTLVHWKEISYNRELNKTTIVWQTRFIDDVAQLRGEVQDITSYYKTYIESKVTSLEAQTNEIQSTITNLNNTISNLQERIVVLESQIASSEEIIEP